MNKSEALQAMRDGHKVTHQYYSADEYAYMKNHRIYTEDGYCQGLPHQEFWSQIQKWEDGWSLFEEKKTAAKIVEIGGTKYVEKPRKPLPKLPTVVHSALMMASMYCSTSSKGRSGMVDVDIVSEYELIQQKASQLSRVQRDWVTKQFEKNFVRI